MGLVLDTNILIDAEHQRPSPKILRHHEAYGEAFLAAVTVSELLAGVHLATTAEGRVQRSVFVEAIISTVPFLPFDEAVARTYAEIYAHFLKTKPRSKKLPNVHDLQIAATAITHGHAILTNNVQDFSKVPGLVVETLDQSQI